MSIEVGLEYVGYIDPWTDEERLSDEEVVRCRECKYRTDSPAWPGAMECDYIGRGVEPDDFCAWGEREDA